MDQKWALFSFQGRMRRRDYWLYSIPVLLVSLPVFLYTTPENAGNPMLNILSIVVLLFVFWASAALNVKRLHDRNKSAWWIILTFLPLIGPIFVIVELGILDGTPGPNQFGADPKGRGAPPSAPGTSPNSEPKDNGKDTMTIDM
ncbi:DUF805 domain-containing protein [Photobacterium rosenbergii]|uniref:DUF805 domain-containing protein n=1 Tax=Photobacterium rosenbergii TaxID=294936 RepID=A0ABU3ZH84_9GAMM|nr:DUF805 domain-containing protein [Photobacterium rosenbergii]MDV5169446.1 DUF805 domain-containing protein [Photobacterium rosenbergii]